MTTFPLLSERRRRRSGRIWLLFGIAILAGLVVLALSVRSERRQVAVYLDTAKEVADEHVDIAARLADVFRTLGTSERPVVLDRLAELETSSQELRSTLEAIEVPGPVAEINGYLTVAMASWRTAIESLDEAFLMNLDEPNNRAGLAMLEAAFENLRVGDRAYEGFQRAIAENEEVVTDYPAVAFVGEDAAGLYIASSVAERLRGVEVLSVRHDISVVGAIVPEPTGEQNGFPLIPFTDSVAVEAVISNVGNEPESGITVLFDLAPLRADQEPVSAQQTIDALGPDEATTVTFDALPVEPGIIYEVVVRAQILGTDLDPENDAWSLVFIRNDAS